MLEKTYIMPLGMIHYWIHMIDTDIATLVLPGLTADHRLFEKQIENQSLATQEVKGTKIYNIKKQIGGTNMDKLFKRDFTTAAEKIRLKNGYVFLIICSLAAFFMGISVFEVIPKNIGYFIITAISFGAMCASTMFGVSIMTAAQQQTPPHLLGKIMAVIIAVSSCSQPVGQAVSLYSKKVFAVLEKESVVK